MDIQLLCLGEDIDLSAVDELGRRLFDFRKKGEWPPTVIAHPGWNALYGDAAKDLNVRPLPEAITWINSLVAEASSHGSHSP